MTHQAPRANLLGDLRAEADTAMLVRAYYDTPDFRTLIESSDRTLVVGRRGTGKSALAYRLAKHWQSAQRTHVVSVSPEEDQVIALRPLVGLFGDTYRGIRAGSRIAWRYAFALEIACALRRAQRFRQSASDTLTKHTAAWLAAGDTCSERLRTTLRSVIRGNTPEERIGSLARDLQLSSLLDSLHAVLDETKTACVLLVDRLDEGFEPDGAGVAFVAGTVHAGIDLNTNFERVRPVLFLRDNIYRSISQADPDASRDIEGQVIRLHWAEYDLFNLVVNRLRVAFSVDIENNKRVWDRCTAAQLHGMDGFRQCLRLTLYRPRDLLALLNEAFFRASRQDRREIAPSDLDETARAISQNRLDDLKKEYATILPGLSHFISALARGPAELPMTTARQHVQSTLDAQDVPVPVAQDLAIHATADAVLRSLYSVGFLGVKDPVSGSFRFCHDGQVGASAFDAEARLLVHPCYWLALNFGQDGLAPEEAREIHDEYDIAVVSATPEVREARIGALIARLGQTPEGTEGAPDFEQWCLDSLRIVCSGHLRNIILHPNSNALQRRDVVGTNLGETAFWRRLREDYAVRQVIFEAKNYADLSADDYRQVLSYLHGEYGRLAFVITRDEAVEPRTGRDLDWIRELFFTKQVLVVKLTGKWLARLLGKLRSPQKHDAVTDQFSSLLDSYTRLYLAGQGASPQRKRRDGN